MTCPPGHDHRADTAIAKRHRTRVSPTVACNNAFALAHCCVSAHWPRSVCPWRPCTVSQHRTPLSRLLLLLLLLRCLPLIAALDGATYGSVITTTTTITSGGSDSGADTMVPRRQQPGSRQSYPYMKPARTSLQQPQLPLQSPWEGPRCISTDGVPVDWWVLLKYPNGQLAALMDSDSLPPQRAAPSALNPTTGGFGERGRVDGDSGRGGQRGSSSGDGNRDGDDRGGRVRDERCWWRAGLDVNDPKGPLRLSLAAAAGGGSAVRDVGTGRSNSNSSRGGGGLRHGGSSESSHKHAWTPPPPSVPGPEVTGFAFYNDADPEGVEHWGFAHAKGALLFGRSGGVWLTHSFPSFPGRPPSDKDLVSPESAPAAATVATAAAAAPDPWDVVRHAQTVYGQHALCLTLPREDLLSVAESLLVAQAYVYEHRMPYELAGQYAAVQELIDASGAEGAVSSVATTAAVAAAAAAGNIHGPDGLPRRLGSDKAQPLPPPPPPPQNVSQRWISTLGGSAWLHVTKSPNHTVPFHEEVLEPLLGADMAWETWRVGTSYGSECPPDSLYDSLNVRRVVMRTCAKFIFSDSGARPHQRRRQLPSSVDGRVDSTRDGGDRTDEDIWWDSLKDHSKWGISTQGLMKPIGRSDGSGGAAHGERDGREYSAEDVYVCFGDLNRQPSQRFRGGGYVCSDDSRVWEAFRTLVAELEPCPSESDIEGAAGAAGAGAGAGDGTAGTSGEGASGDRMT